MIELFNQGGILFMSLLSLEFIIVIGASIRYASKDQKDASKLDLIKSLGLLALVTGVLGQLIGLFSAFDFIQQMGTVSPAMLAGGLKVSLITTLYGVIIYVISLVIWLLLKIRN